VNDRFRVYGTVSDIQLPAKMKAGYRKSLVYSLVAASTSTVQSGLPSQLKK